MTRARLIAHVATLLVAATWLCHAHAAPAVEQSFLIRQFEDGAMSSDLFEVWQVRFDRSSEVPLLIQVASFAELNGQTYVHVWIHSADRITEVRPGIFKAECNGRLNPFAGLDVVFEVSGDRIVEISGSTRSGTKGQSIVAYKADHKTRRIAMQLANPSWQP